MTDSPVAAVEHSSTTQKVRDRISWIIRAADDATAELTKLASQLQTVVQQFPIAG